ncbi:hypothetical protein [Actinomadura rupiterrae]|uniref:hypothetical protein n=1 Tax=Actinomadura rupiterrae TaxID=559627 RepID=UPI0020A5C775|nr:hypothetical protein [Actinomadura rupiterrae]MCP2339127.1 hypothetical protein [Actinomadura rupiterrae]
MTRQATRRLLATAAAAAVLAASAAGCGGGGDKNSKATAWAAKVCDTVGQNKLPLPNFGNGKNAKVVKTGYLNFLDSLNLRLQRVELALKGAGLPPVDNGGKTYDLAMSNLRSAQTAVTGVRTDVGKAPVNNVVGFQKAVAKASPAMSRFTTYQGPVKDLRTNAKLNSAFDDAPSCKANKL